MRKNLFKVVLYVCVLIAATLGAIVSLAEFVLMSDRKTNPSTATRTLDTGGPRLTVPTEAAFRIADDENFSSQRPAS